MYAAVRSPTLLPIPTAVHGQWRVPGSNAPAAGPSPHKKWSNKTISCSGAMISYMKYQ